MLLRRHASLALAAVFLLATASSALAQSASGTLSGVVRDESGGVLSGAAVTARNVATGTARRVVTDTAGRYILANLDPGEYELRAEQQGFKTAVRSGVLLSVGAFVVADVQMSVGQVAEEVTVIEREPLVETTKTDLSRVVGATEIDSLPNIGRNFVDFVKLSSGVAIGRENIGGGAFKEPDTGVGVAAAPRLSFGGQSELNTLIQVDGADNVQTFTGLPRATPSQEAAREFRILNSTYLAEYGRALGGFVNIVTKSGGNDTQGSVYYFGMDAALAARSPLVQPDSDVLRQHQYGGTLGGPLVKDRTFYFVNYEGQRREESNGFSQVIIDNIETLNRVRSRFGLTPETLDQVRTNDYDQFLVKLDHQMGENNRFSVRYNYLNSEALLFPGGGGRASPASTAARNNAVGDQALVANLVSVLSPKAVNEARFQWARRRYDFEATVNEPALEISNLIIMGKTTSDMDFYRETRFQLTDSVIFTAGDHQIKVGADYNHIQDNAVWNLFFPARIIFPNLAAFSSFIPVVFWWPTLKDDPVRPVYDTSWAGAAVPAQWQDDTVFDESHSLLGFFAQDQWRATDKLTVTYGLRYDLESYPEPYILEKDVDNIQPRLGLAYAYSPRGVIRAGYGLFTDRLASSVGQLLTASGWSARGDLASAQTLFPGVAPVRGRFFQNTVGGPAAPVAALAFLTNGVVPAATGTGLADNMDGYMKNPYSHQASAQVSQAIGGVAVSASYLYVGAREVPIHGSNLNAVQTGTTASGKPSYAGGRRDPALGDFFVTTNQGFSTYHGGTLEVARRFDGRVGFHASYTYSRSRSRSDSVANLADLWQGPDGSAEDAFSRQHVPHRFTLSFLSQVPRDVPVLGELKLSFLVSSEGGRRFTQYAGSDANGDGNPNSDRTGLVGRNTIEGPSYTSVDVRVAREFPLGMRVRGEVSVDAFNLFNKENVKDLNTNFGSDNPNATPNPLLGYLTPRALFNPFQMQIGLRVRF
jgi:Carboxypeptidase regulatory-like domain/TonB dependent receptor